MKKGWLNLLPNSKAGLGEDILRRSLMPDQLAFLSILRRTRILNIVEHNNVGGWRTVSGVSWPIIGQSRLALLEEGHQLRLLQIADAPSQPNGIKTVLEIVLLHC